MALDLTSPVQVSDATANATYAGKQETLAYLKSALRNPQISENLPSLMCIQVF